MLQGDFFAASPPPALPCSTRRKLLEMLTAAGYSNFRFVRGGLCAMQRYNFTTALVVGLDEVGYERRYCYEHAVDARAALRAWDGKDHPPGPWIKCKGAGIDLLNPALR